MVIKNEKDKENLLEGGRRLATVLQKVAEKVAPGVSTKELDNYAEKLILDMGDTPAFKDYTPIGAKRPYPATLCISINDEIVHGIPNEEDKILKDGDIVTLDSGLNHNGYFLDHAITVPVGNVDKNGLELIDTARVALEKALEIIKPGIKVGEIGFLIEGFVKEHGFVPAYDFGGHGVGAGVHEDPFIPNFGPKNRGPALEEGQVVAIEPIINEGGPGARLLRDGYTYATEDGKRSAQFEHTVLIEKNGPVILTKL